MIKPDTIIALKKDQYRIIEEIGFGAYGVVWKAERISDGVMVAVKTVQTRNPENRSPFSQSFLAKIIEVQNKEIEFLRRLTPEVAMHNHILPLLDFGRFSDAPAMVLPLCSHSLAEVYGQRTDSSFQFDGATLLRWIWQIAAALKTVHTLPGKPGEPGKYSHRDLKLQNVLVKDNDLYLSDYGTVKRIGQDLTFSLAGTPNWGAPEMLLPKKYDHGEPTYQFDESADLYPLGLLIHILVTGNYTRAQGEIVDLLSMSGKPLAGAEKKFDKIGGLTEREQQTLKIDMRRIFIDEDKTILAKSDDLLPEPELSLPDSEQIIAQLYELVNNLLAAKAEQRPTARQVHRRAKRMEELFNPALDALNIEIPNRVKLGRPYFLRIRAKGRGLPSDGRWLNIIVAGKTAELRMIEKIADNTWMVELEPLSKVGDYTVKAYAWVNDHETESDEDCTIRLAASAAQLWEQGDYIAALIKKPDKEDWLNALELKSRKKRAFQRDYLAILDAVRKKHPDHTDINRRYWRLRHGEQSDVKKAPIIRWLFGVLLVISLLAAEAGIFYLMGARFIGKEQLISLKNGNAALQKADQANKDKIDQLQEAKNANESQISALLKKEQTLKIANEQLSEELSVFREHAFRDIKKRKAQRIDTLLQTAAEYRKNNKLTSPTGANAYEVYLTVLKSDPGNDKALEGIKKIADSYETLALKAFKSKKYDQADKYLRKGLEVAPEHKALLALNLKIERKKNVARLTPAPKQIASPYVKVTHPQRSALRTVSDDEFKVVFKLDKNRRPKQYVPITSNRFQKIENDQVIKDNATGLMWQQSGSTKQLQYSTAQQYIKWLNTDRFAGFRDWRLPTADELTSLLAKTKQNTNLHIDPLFNKLQLWCWSVDKRAPGWAWGVNFDVGKVGWYNQKNDDLYVRAVRTEQ